MTVEMLIEKRKSDEGLNHAYRQILYLEDFIKQIAIELGMEEKDQMTLESFRDEIRLMKCNCCEKKVAQPNSANPADAVLNEVLAGKTKVNHPKTKIKKDMTIVGDRIDKK